MIDLSCFFVDFDSLLIDDVLDEMVVNIEFESVLLWFYEVKIGDIIWMGVCDN